MFPVALGAGKRLFAEGTTTKLALAASDVYDNGVVHLAYRSAEYIDSSFALAGDAEARRDLDVSVTMDKKEPAGASRGSRMALVLRLEGEQ